MFEIGAFRESLTMLLKKMGHSRALFLFSLVKYFQPNLLLTNFVWRSSVATTVTPTGLDYCPFFHHDCVRFVSVSFC